VAAGMLKCVCHLPWVIEKRSPHACMTLMGTVRVAGGRAGVRPTTSDTHLAAVVHDLLTT